MLHKCGDFCLNPIASEVNPKNASFFLREFWKVYQLYGSSASYRYL